MESRVSSNCTRNIHRPSTVEKEVNRNENTVGKIAKRRQLRKFTHAQIQMLANFYSIMYCFSTKKIRIFRARFIAFPLVEYLKICLIVEHISVLPSACFQKIHRTKFEIEDKTQNCKQQGNCLCNPIFFGLQMIGGTNCTNCEHFERSYPSKLKKIKSKAKLTLASTKIILIIFTKANESLNPAHCLLMAFSDLEMKKNTPKKLQEKHYADARVNIEQKLSSS